MKTIITITISISIILLFVFTSCTQSISAGEKYQIEESDDNIISAPLCLSYRYGKVLFADQTGKMVFLYAKDGKLIKSFSPDLRFSDTIARMNITKQDYQFTFTSNYLNYYPNNLENGILRNMLGNMYINCCFIDSNNIACGGIFGVLMQKRDFEEHQFGIATRGIINEYSLTNNKVKSIPLPFSSQPYGVVKPHTLLYDNNSSNYVLDFTSEQKSKTDTNLMHYALSRCNTNSEIRDVFFNLPQILTSPYLSEDFIKVSKDNSNNIWCAFPKITKIYNTSGNYSFDLVLDSNTNHIYLDSMSAMKDVNMEQWNAKYDELIPHLRYEIKSIYNYHDDILVYVKDLIDSTHILQLYSTSGELLNTKTFDKPKDKTEIYNIAYGIEDKEFIFIRLEDEHWNFVYQKEELVF